VVATEDLAKLSAFRPQGTLTKSPIEHDYVLSQLETTASRELDEIVVGGEVPELCPETAFTEQMGQQPSESYDQVAMNELVERNERHVACLDGLFRDLVASSATDTEPLETICRDSLETAARDLDLFACLGASPYSSNYPHRHSLHVATVSVAIGIKLGLGEQALLDLARGCLIHDVGMLTIPKETFSAKRRLTKREIEQVVDHPIRTLDALESHLDAIPLGAQIVAIQMHERCNGSGYPRGRTTAQLHQLGKIAAVADAFVALVATRPHREGIQPYYVMTKLLQDVKAGLFDPDAVRGLLRAVSVFPIGSFIETNDGNMGRVIRSNGNAYDRPVVELWTPEKLAAKPSVVNLLQEQDLRVVRILPKLEV
jgi:HD-GYP domain-containing protein (c-di-GMP phosphodiesterase class II)